jgi:hypothetical protein
MPPKQVADTLDRILTAIPPASGAVVMGTGIVSIGLSLDGQETISRVMLVLDAVIWGALAVLLAARAARDHPRFRADVRTPAALSAVAGMAVLGSRFTMLSWGWAGVALLVVALVLWAALLVPVLTNWVTPSVGSSLLLAVSTESLAVLAAELATREPAHWLLYASLAPFLLGLAFYGFVIRSFEIRQIAIGRGDHWITGGALAISTLAAGRITLTAKGLHALSGITEALKVVSLALWALAVAWLPVLLSAEALRPRLRYDVRRWSTVFPVGMYAACSFIVGTAVHAPGITDFARIWVWAGVAIWLFVFLAMLGRGWRLVRGEDPALNTRRNEQLACEQRRSQGSP